MSERNEKPFSKLQDLLGLVQGIEVLLPKREDECCGFGGTFCVSEEAVSVKMGQDRIKEHDVNAVEYIIGADTSCLMHMEGILRRQGSKVQVKHIVEILNYD
jgi:L-lactate dehydrogenase complex protein LldE